MNDNQLQVYLIDDEPLAIKRLARLLTATGKTEIIGSSINPKEAIEFLSHHSVDLIFLDIEMPDLNGFELLARLPNQPLVIFTTAYNKYALRAFEVNSIDFLLKPIEPPKLARALEKIEKLRACLTKPQWQTNVAQLAEHLATNLLRQSLRYINIVSSRVGDRIHLIEVANITHFFAEEKLTFAATTEKHHVIDLTISELEARLDPEFFFRIHRSTIVNLAFVSELDAWFMGSVNLRLKDTKQTELTVARHRVRLLKERLGIL